MIFPKIPTRIFGRGDEVRVEELKAFANKRLADLSRSMFFQNLTTSVSRIILADGSAIICEINHGISRIFIDTPVLVTLEDAVLGQDLFCHPCFALSQITEAHPAGDEFGSVYGEFVKARYDIVAYPKYDLLRKVGVEPVVLVDYPIYSASFDEYIAGAWVVVCMKNTYNLTTLCCKDMTICDYIETIDSHTNGLLITCFVPPEVSA